MKKFLKVAIFVLIIVGLIFGIRLIRKTGTIKALEGYMYALASEITGNSTDCNATSSNATSSNATSSNATSSNATSSNATSSNATSSNATSSNATSSNVNNGGIKVTNTPEIQNDETTKKIVNIEVAPVKEETEEDLEYNNSKITESIIKKIKSSKKNLIITADSNTKISADLFEAIKGQDRQLTINSGDNQVIFNGKDIDNPKDIDVAITYNLVSQDAELNKITENGIVINFADNGELPGAATVRVKATEEMKAILETNTMYVYYYNETNKELVKLSNNAILKNEYIEFAINHNSKYVLVNEEIIENDGRTEITDDTVTFLESHKMYIIIIIISIVTIIGIVVILIVDKKQRTK